MHKQSVDSWSSKANSDGGERGVMIPRLFFMASEFLRHDNNNKKKSGGQMERWEWAGGFCLRVFISETQHRNPLRFPIYASKAADQNLKLSSRIFRHLGSFIHMHPLFFK